MASPGKIPNVRGDHAGVGAMTPKPTDWNERHLVETPAVELLQSHGYTHVPPEDLEPERPSLKEPILTGRLAAALLRLNPWLSETNLARAVKAVTRVTAASLAHPTGKTMMTTIQKFQEMAGADSAGRAGSTDKTRSAGKAGTGTGGDGRSDARRRSVHPTLSEAANIFVMVDEAHRTQYRSLAANMRQALPNACFLGFTGTPIDKKDRSTLRTFGPYIDTYTIEQAVQDGATVPIFYESRLPELHIIGQTIDQVFDRVFADRTEDERAVIRQRFATEQAIAGAPRRIEAVCLDLIDHFTRFIAPNGFKAQVVATSRHTAVTFKETLDRLNAPESAVIMSAGHNDEARLARRHLRKDEQDRLIERFKDRGDPLAILVVCDMLLTGFDAPIEQVMYLDAPLKEHTLLQAIARVNRPRGEEKTYGLVVDYWGVSAKLKVESLAADIVDLAKVRTDR